MVRKAASGPWAASGKVQGHGPSEVTERASRAGPGPGVAIESGRGPDGPTIVAALGRVLARSGAGASRSAGRPIRPGSRPVDFPREFADSISMGTGDRRLAAPGRSATVAAARRPGRGATARGLGPSPRRAEEDVLWRRRRRSRCPRLKVTVPLAAAALPGDLVPMDGPAGEPVLDLVLEGGLADGAGEDQRQELPQAAQAGRRARGGEHGGGAAGGAAAAGVAGRPVRAGGGRVPGGGQGAPPARAGMIASGGLESVNEKPRPDGIVRRGGVNRVVPRVGLAARPESIRAYRDRSPILGGPAGGSD